MLTDLQCRTAKPKEKPYRLADNRGLYLYIATSGGKSWRYNYKINGKQYTYTYGVYPEIPLLEARERHNTIHKMVSDGINPHEHEKKQKWEAEKAKAFTFRTMANQWLEKRKAEVKPKTIADIEKRLNIDVMPSIGDVPMSELDPPTFLVMIRKIEARGAYEMANRARQYCSQILRYAVACGKAERDFTLDIGDALAVHKVQHQPALSPNEIPEFLKALERNEARLDAWLTSLPVYNGKGGGK